MKLLTKEHLKSLKVGDAFMSEGLFQKLCDDPVVWTLTDGGNPEAGEYVFEATYLGVRVAEFCAKVTKRGVSVEEL